MEAHHDYDMANGSYGYKSNRIRGKTEKPYKHTHTHTLITASVHQYTSQIIKIDIPFGSHSQLTAPFDTTQTIV